MDQQERPGESIRLDMNSLAHQLSQELATLDSSRAQHGGRAPPRGDIIVGKVDEGTRLIDPGEYDPYYVSIGPYHGIGNPELASADAKLGSFKALRLPVAAVGGLDADEMACLEARARSCYHHRFGMTSNEFVRMLLLDACYILSHKFGLGGVGASTTVELGEAPLVSTAGGDDSRSAEAQELLKLVCDVFYLAENQIPFFVIEKIGELTTPDGGAAAVQGIKRYALDLLEKAEYAAAAPSMGTPGPGNLLHLLHMHLKPTAPLPESAGGRKVGRWRSATDYYYAGVKFKSRTISAKGDVRCILDVKLRSGAGTLEVPRLIIDGQTWRLLRNLIALEQWNPVTAGSHVTAYCLFMSQLACTPTDVELLARRGVIVHSLGNDGEVADLFAGLCKGIVFDVDDPGRNYLRPTCQALEKRFQSRLWRWIAWLRRKYFSNPWLAVGLVAAAIGLACTVIQAVYSVLSYNSQPPN